MINGDIQVLDVIGDISSSITLDADINNSVELETTINPITKVAENDYNKLQNKPQINYVELVDNKTLDELNIQVKGEYADSALTNAEIEELLDNFS